MYIDRLIDLWFALGRRKYAKWDKTKEKTYLWSTLMNDDDDEVVCPKNETHAKWGHRLFLLKLLTKSIQLWKADSYLIVCLWLKSFGDHLYLVLRHWCLSFTITCLDQCHCFALLWICVFVVSFENYYYRFLCAFIQFQSITILITNELLGIRNHYFMEWLFSLVKRHATCFIWQVKVMPQSTEWNSTQFQYWEYSRE